METLGDMDTTTLMLNQNLNETLNATSAPEWKDCTLFNFVVWGIIAGLLSIFGFFGNSLSLAAFQRDKRVSSTTLLQCLAVSDFMLLLSVFLTDSVPYICSYTDTCSNPWYSWPYIRYVWLLVPCSHMCSIWFVVLVALNRFWAVCRPHDMRKVWSVQRTAYYTLVVVAVVFAFNSPRFFEYSIDEYAREDNSTYMKETKTAFGTTTSYKVVYKVMLVNICLVMVPIVLLIVLTTKILVTLNITRRKVDSKSSMAKGASEITFVLTLVVVVSIICQTPLAAFHFVRYTTKYHCGDFVFYLDNISKLLVNVNSSINFMIYCFFSPKFRKLLLAAMCCSAVSLVPMETYSVAGSMRTKSVRTAAERNHKKDLVVVVNTAPS